MDNLSHDRCRKMSPEELHAYLSENQDGFPMEAPQPDMNLGINLVRWLADEKS